MHSVLHLSLSIMGSLAKRLMVPVDGDETSIKAMRYATQKALEMQLSDIPVTMVLVNLYSSWDLTGAAEREGRLALDQAESFAEVSGVRNGIFVFCF